MDGFSCGQGVPLHRGLHMQGASTNLNKCFIYYCRVHRPPIAQPSWIALERFALER